MSEPANTLRGNVIRVPGERPGLIVANGRQWPFEIAGVWLSPVAPALNQTVDVTLDENGTIVGITAVAGSQQAAEKLKQAAGVAAAWAQGPGMEKLNQAKEWVASQPDATKKLGLRIGIGVACLASLVFALLWLFASGTKGIDVALELNETTGDRGWLGGPKSCSLRLKVTNRTDRRLNEIAVVFSAYPPILVSASSVAPNRTVENEETVGVACGDLEPSIENVMCELEGHSGEQCKALITFKVAERPELSSSKQKAPSQTSEVQVREEHRLRGNLARAQLGSVALGIEAYYLDTGKFPASLSDLRGKYLKESMLKDPWGTSWVYRTPGSNGRLFDLLSYGADGKPGGDDVNSDIIIE